MNLLKTKKYKAFFHSWRPKTFNDIKGQNYIVQTLKNAVLYNRISYAYLFIGPRGSGKTSTARILAKAINCKDKHPISDNTNNDKCEICDSIDNGYCLDVIEIDGASNNSVEQIRHIKEACEYMPSTCKYKIYIIDEVHMLSNAAFNALLKTLEEPPDYVRFILATTEIDKIPLTVISRCQNFQFRKLENDLIIESLINISKSENIKIENNAIKRISKMSDGSLRDAQLILDQVIICFYDLNSIITEYQVIEMYGLISSSIIDKISQYILEGNKINLLKFILPIINDKSFDFYQALLDLIHNINDKIINFLSTEFNTKLEILSQIFSTLNEFKYKMKNNFNDAYDFLFIILKSTEVSEKMNKIKLVGDTGLEPVTY